MSDLQDNLEDESFETFEPLDFEDENQDECNDVDEIDIELIKLVKSNPILWNKSSKSYNNNVEKNRIWEYIGSVLPIKMTGNAAAKRFRTLRTTFSRHFKKVKQSQPRSGAGSDWSIYKPTWPLYEELLFLADVIKPRQTKSNTFVKPTNVLKPKTSNHENIMHNAIIASGSNRSTTQVIHSSPTYSSQLQQTSSDINQIGISEKNNSSQNYTQILHSNITESDNESSAESSASIYEHSTKRKPLETPPPDNFFRKKKVKHDQDMNNLDKLAGALITISQQIVESPDQHEERTTLTAADSEDQGEMLVEVQAILHDRHHGQWHTQWSVQYEIPKLWRLYCHHVQEIYMQWKNSDTLLLINIMGADAVDLLSSEMGELELKVHQTYVATYVYK